MEATAISRQLRVSSDRLSTAMERLSSGLRINSAGDDAAGLGISERLRGQIRGLEVSNRNIQDGMSMLNVMDQVLDGVASILQRARELAVQYNNGTYSDEDKANIAVELIALSDEISRIEQTTQFNGIMLMQDATATVTLQVGANQGETMVVSLVDLFGPGLNLVRPISFFTLPWLDADISGLDLHIQDVAGARGRLGAMSNRLEHALNANQNLQANLMSAESRIRDTDMAQEMTELVRNRVLQQSGAAMLKTAMNPSTDRIKDLLG